MRDSGPRKGLLLKVYILVVMATIAGGIGLRWEAINSGLGSDDYLEYAILKGVYPAARPPWDLFNFTDGTEKEVQQLMDFGALPWWSHPRIRLAMMRPLSSVLILFDHYVFGKNIRLFHVHTFLWWAFLIIAVAAIFYLFLPVHIAATAIVLFATEEGHTVPVVWLANRSALVSLSLGLWGLYFHIRFSQNGSKSYLIISITMFLFALLAGEWAFPIFSYLFAYQILWIKDPIKKRLRALLPAFILCLFFISTQSILHYSVLNSEVYINPIVEPLSFLYVAIQRIPVFIADLVFGIPSSWWHNGPPWKHYLFFSGLFTPETWNLIPDWQFWHIVIGIFATLLSLLGIRWGIRSMDPDTKNGLNWLLLGAALALIPTAASFPSTRLIVPAYIGIAAICSMLLIHLIATIRISIIQLRWSNLFIAVFLLLGLGYSQIWKAVTRSYHTTISRSLFYESVKEWILQADIDDSIVSKQDIILINSIEHTSMLFTPFVRYFYGHPLPRSCRILSAAPRAHDIERISEKKLLFSVLGGTFLMSDLERLYRSDRFPFKTKDSVELKGLKVDILRMLNNKPLHVLFSFEKPLEDPSYLFLHSSVRGLQRFRIPKIGERIRLPKARVPNIVLLSRL